MTWRMKVFEGIGGLGRRNEYNTLNLRAVTQTTWQQAPVKVQAYLLETLYYVKIWLKSIFCWNLKANFTEN